MNESSINIYLRDDEAVLRAWHQKYFESQISEHGIELTGGLPGLNDIKLFFNAWLDRNLTLIQKHLCPKYRKILEQSENEIEIIAGIATILGEFYDYNVELAVLIFKYGLDRLCIAYESNKKDV